MRQDRNQSQQLHLFRVQLQTGRGYLAQQRHFIYRAHNCRGIKMDASDHHTCIPAPLLSHKRTQYEAQLVELFK